MEQNTVGRYVLVAQLGAAGAGAVFAAFDPELDRKVAIKLLRADAGLLHQAQALARLNHPNVLPVYDVGTFQERVFVAMEFVDGGTLREWLARPRPLGEVVEVFAQAGRGLAAAHAAGLVHGGFDADSVLVGRVETGVGGLSPRGTVPPRVVVTNFSLVALAGDARDDQQRFCAALAAALRSEEPSRLPRYLDRLLRRGLSASAGERFPTMDALLVALAADPARRRRRVLASAAVLTVTAALLLAGGLAARRQSQLCRGAERKLAGVWDAPARATLDRVFAASGVPSARLIASSAAAILDRYAAAWTAARTDACEATRVRGEQPEAVLSLRIACLDRRLAELAALSAILGEADRSVVRHAVEAAAGLPPVGYCADVAALSAPVPLPATAEARQRVGAVRDRLVRAQALGLAGRYAAALTEATAAATAAQAVGYAPLEAEAKTEEGVMLSETGDNRAAEPLLEQAVYAGARGRHNLAVARAALGLVSVTGFWLARYADGHRWARLAQSAIARLGGDESLRISLLRKQAALYNREGAAAQSLASAREALALSEKVHGPAAVQTALIRVVVGNAELSSGNLAAARRAYEAALASYERVVGAEHPLVADPLNNLGNVAYLSDDYAGAERYYRRALALSIDTLGPDHPDTASRLSNLGAALLRLERPAEALASFRSAATIYAAKLAPGHPDSLESLVGVGESLVALGRAGEAVAPLERALAVCTRHQVDPETLAEARFALAEARWATGRRAEALALARQARSGYLQVPRAGRQVEGIDRWMAAHGSTASK